MPVAEIVVVGEILFLLRFEIILSVVYFCQRPSAPVRIFVLIYCAVKASHVWPLQKVRPNSNLKTSKTLHSYRATMPVA